MCIDLQENIIKEIKFNEEIYQFIELFKGWIICQQFQYLLNTKTMFMNRGGHDLKTTNYGEHFTFCNPELTLKTCLHLLCKSPERSQKINFNI